MLNMEIKRWIVSPSPHSHSSSTLHYKSLLGWTTWNCHHSAISNPQKQQHCIVWPKKNKTLPIYPEQSWVFCECQNWSLLPTHIHLSPCYLLPHFCSSSCEAHLTWPGPLAGSSLPALCWEILLHGFLSSSPSHWVCQHARPWPFFTWAISQVCDCSEQPSGIRSCLPLAQEADLFIVCYETADVPSLVFLICNTHSSGSMALPQWTWEARETDPRADNQGEYSAVNNEVLYLRYRGLMSSSTNPHETVWGQPIRAQVG